MERQEARNPDWKTVGPLGLVLDTTALPDKDGDNFIGDRVVRV